jgi:hypothetical protein
VVVPAARQKSNVAVLADHRSTFTYFSEWRLSCRRIVLSLAADTASSLFDIPKQTKEKELDHATRK